MIEAFAEINNPTLPGTPASRNSDSLASYTNTLDELRLWLLKNKQTSQWKTTKATTEAIYALLFTGTQWLTLDKSVDVTIGNQKPDFSKDEVAAGTGYTKATWQGSDIKQDMSKVTITKSDEGVAWGGLYWQYFEDLDKITSAATPLKLSKKVFLVSNTDRGELLTELSASPGTPSPLATRPPGSLKVGDLVRIRIELSSDRALAFSNYSKRRRRKCNENNFWCCEWVRTRSAQQPGIFLVVATSVSLILYRLAFIKLSVYPVATKNHS